MGILIVKKKKIPEIDYKEAMKIKILNIYNTLYYGKVLRVW